MDDPVHVPERRAGGLNRREVRMWRSRHLAFSQVLLLDSENRLRHVRETMVCECVGNRFAGDQVNHAGGYWIHSKSPFAIVQVELGVVRAIMLDV